MAPFKESPNIFEDVPKIDHTEPPPPTDAQAFEVIARSRRSVRVYDGSPVPEEVMRKCLDLALLAPNSSNLQPWRFYWVRSADKKQALIQACLSQPAAKTASELIVAVARTKVWSEHAQQMIAHLQSKSAPPAAMHYYQKIVPLAYSMGPFGIFGPIKKLLLFLRGLTKVTPREPASLSDMKVWAHKSTALACQNLMLAFRAYGFDTCPMEGLDSSRVSKILDLPADASVCMAISVGKRAPNGVYGPQLRFDRQQFIFEI